MTLVLHDTVPLLQQTRWQCLLDCFPRKKKIHEWKCELIVCVQCAPDGRGRVIVMHSRVFTAIHSVVSSLGYEAQCCPCLKHLRCGLACEVKQTGLNEIRLDEHDWSQSNNLRWLLVSVALASVLATLKRISIVLASLTLAYLSSEHQGACNSQRGKRAGSVCYLHDVGEHCCQFIGTPAGSQVLLHQWASQDKPFLLFCFSCILYWHFIKEWVSALNLLPGQILSHDYALRWNQITGKCCT